MSTYWQARDVIATVEGITHAKKTAVVQKVRSRQRPDHLSASSRREFAGLLLGQSNQGLECDS